MVSNRCDISTYPKDNGIDLLFVRETWFTAHGDECKNFN